MNERQMRVMARVEAADGERWATVQAVQRKRRPKPLRHFHPEVLTDDEVRRLMAACSARPTGVRNRALLVVLYRAGLRINEALSLYPKDVDAVVGAIRILNAKGSRSRTVGMDPEGFAILQRWLDVRGARKITDRAPIFCDLNGEPLRTAYFRVLMPRLAAKAGIAKRVHAHGFRHTHAAQLREEGVDIGIISKQLGHRSIATTARYLDHIAPVAVVQAMRGRKW